MPERVEDYFKAVEIEDRKCNFSRCHDARARGFFGLRVDDVEEVSNYVAAMQHGLRRRAGGFPLSLRLIREIHAILLRGGRGANRRPGEFRRSQKWVGGTRPGNAAFVPPPPERLMECLDSLERFLHDEKYKLPILVEAGLIHVQFETIHPFLDGNGRLGRLLITLLLCSKGALREPLLYSACTSKRIEIGTTNCFSAYEHTVPGKSGWPSFWMGRRSRRALPLRPRNRF
jgi:fido (protein-threonine AMPylation protein)